MHLEAHAGVGWLVGVLAPGSDRRLRACCVAATVIPDIDAAPYLHSYDAYARWHHTFGHNIWVGVLLAAVAAWLHRDQPWKRRGLIAGLVGVCFTSHLLTDAWFTRYDVYLFWPLNRYGLLFEGGVGLVAPINGYLVYASMVMAVGLAFWKRVTPLDLFWPRLDRIVINAISKRDLSCGTCETSCNDRCDTCQTPTCLKHGKIRWSFWIQCPSCAGAEQPAQQPDGVSAGDGEAATQVDGPQEPPGDELQTGLANQEA